LSCGQQVRPKSNVRACLRTAYLRAMAAAAEACWSGGAANTFCPHATLGIHPGASADIIRAAFRRAALRTHPDKPGGSAEAFQAAQYANDLLLGHALSADQLSGPWATVPVASADTLWHAEATVQPQPWGAAPAAEAPAAFDPWSASTFDPWSTTSFDQEFANAVGASSAGGSSGSSVAAAYSLSAAQVSAAEAEAAAEAAARKSKKRVLKMANDAKRRRMAGRDGGVVIESEAAKNLTRFGVYGFRPSSSEDEDEEPLRYATGWQAVHHAAAAAQCAAFPGAAAAFASPLGAVGFPQPAPAAGHFFSAAPAAATAANRPSGVRPMVPPRKGAAGCRQFYCSLHNKIRFQSALRDDGSGNPVCRPGMECP